MSDASQGSPPENPHDQLNDHFAACRGLVKDIKRLGKRLELLAIALEPLGASETYPEGALTRRLAELRDHADFCLSQAAGDLSHMMRVRADSTRSVDLLADSVLIARGRGDDCMKLIETFYRLVGDDTEGSGKIDAETFPDLFLWDLAQRVEAFPSFAELYPKHLYFAARHFHGLPMMVSHHIDNTPEFRRLSEMLGLGTLHPLDVSPRRKRGGTTPALCYLEPLVWRLDSLREILCHEVKRVGDSLESERVNWLWTHSYSKKTPEAEIEVLRKLPATPRLTKGTALKWSREIIVPYILLTAGAVPDSSGEPFIRNIWAHRSVKSIPTFRSRLESAVTDFLTRYGRED